MDKLFGITLSSNEWLIKETTFGLDEQHIQESLFTLGNGFIGSRGILEEKPERAIPGTFIAGVYDKSGAQVEELVNLPNPFHFIIAAEGEKLDMRFMSFLKHTRYLDMKKGILVRRTIFKDAKNRRFLYQSLRFLSIDNPHLACMKIAVTLLNGEAELTALDILDDSVNNTGGLIYGSRRHVRLIEADTRSDIDYSAYKTNSSHIWITYADHLGVEETGVSTVLHDRFYDFKLKAGETVTFTKALAICTSLNYRATKLKEETINILQDMLSKGFESVIKTHIDKWESRWKQANIKIAGDDLCDKALRFNVYHLLIAGYKGNFPMNIGARALTGQGYRGHIFWDSEIFILPFFIYIDPVIAKNILLYRYHRLNMAKENAKKRGYEGALFPWESGRKGDDVTPRYGKDIDGSVIKNDTMDFEQHISADIAFGVFNYYRATDDVEFMLYNGAEIIFETARFWASRVIFNQTKNQYEILDVTGPDEFHNCINNNAYTNIMAGWNMSYAYRLYHELNQRQPKVFERILHRIRITKRDFEKWKEISDKIYFPQLSQNGIIEQFDGYFKKRKVAIKIFDNHFMPEAPKHISYKDFDKTQFIKQADVLLLFYLLPEYFSQQKKRKNYDFYLKRTLHQSSLSHSIHAWLAAELKDYLRAYIFFLFAAQVDLKNLHNNTDGGMHMASIGGTWQAAIFGFGGIYFEDNGIIANPQLPSHWSSMEFSIFWRKHLLKFKVSNDKVLVYNYPIGSSHQILKIRIFEKRYALEPFQNVEVKRHKKEREMKRIKHILKKEHLVFVNQNAPIKNIIHLLLEKKIGGVPVTDDNNELKGIIAENEVLKVMDDKDFSRLKAKDIMNKNVEYVKENDHIEIAIRLFTERQYRVLPVLKGKTVVGVITRKEIFAATCGDYY